MGKPDGKDSEDDKIDGNTIAIVVSAVVGGEIIAAFDYFDNDGEIHG